MTKRIIAAALGLLCAVSLLGCTDSGSMDDYLQQHKVILETSMSDVKIPETEPVSESDVSYTDVSGADVSASDVTTTTTASTTAAEKLSGTLPEYFIGTWGVVSVYQEAAASDVSLEEALRREQLNGISFGSSYFDRSVESVNGAVFKVNENATFKDMERFGISTQPLVGPYGNDAKIVSVEVSTADGLVCTTVFLINDLTLIAFGSGMNVYTYEQMNAVG